MKSKSVQKQTELYDPHKITKDIKSLKLYAEKHLTVFFVKTSCTSASNHNRLCFPGSLAELSRTISLPNFACYSFQLLGGSAL